jgi:hypothetical protein
MPIIIQLRRDTAGNWTTNNPILASGELGIETDTGKFKLGNGTNSWSVLQYGGIIGPNASDFDPFFLFGRG